MNNSKLGARKWFSFILAGLVGQLAWAIENMYLNVFVYDVTSVYKFIPIMTAASAAAATITTLLIGALSDRLGKRKAFIAFGYIIWGISIIAFALFDPHSMISIVGSGSTLLSGTMIVILDCVMTFFGSTANDACFNAFVTDNTSEDNRGKVESILSILPMVAMIAIVVIAGILVNDTGHNWDLFFIIFGALTSGIGIICLFLLPKDVVKANKDEPYIRNIFYGFRPTVIKENPMLYILLIAFMIFNIAIQTFFPYLIVYINNLDYVLANEVNSTITLGSSLGISCIVTVIFGLFMDKIGKNKILIPSLLIGVIGCVLLFIFKDMVGVIIGGIILLSGYMVTTAVMGAKIRDYTPKNEVGLFQGIRMIFAVLLPMVSGPYLGRALSHINGTVITNEYNIQDIAPNKYIFIGGAFVLLLTIIPLLILIKKERIYKNEQDLSK